MRNTLLAIALLGIAACGESHDTDAKISQSAGAQRPALDVVDDSVQGVRCYLARGEISGYVGGVITTISCVPWRKR